MAKSHIKLSSYPEKEIKKRLIDRELTQKDVARQIGVTPQTISFVIKQKRTSRRVAEAICRLLELDYTRLFGDGNFRQAS